MSVFTSFESTKGAEQVIDRASEGAEEQKPENQRTFPDSVWLLHLVYNVEMNIEVWKPKDMVTPHHMRFIRCCHAA